MSIPDDYQQNVGQWASEWLEKQREMRRARRMVDEEEAAYVQAVHDDMVLHEEPILLYGRQWSGLIGCNIYLTALIVIGVYILTRIVAR